MARFADELPALLSGEGVSVPDGFGDALTALYTSDMDETRGDLNTIIAERDAKIRQMMAESAIQSIPDEKKDSFDDNNEDDVVEADFDDFFSDTEDDK